MIGIITDSTCDIPETLIEQYGIVVIPQMIIWEDKQYRDRIDMQPKEFYDRLTVSPQYPHSSMPGIQDFQEAFKKAINQGATELIILTVSSAMSGTYEMAKNAVKSLKINTAVVDSKGPTMSLGWQVLAAARARDMGADFTSILNYVDQVRKKMCQFVAMNSIEYLQKGGRIGEAVKWAGTLLKVKPLVKINHLTGLVEPVSLARTHDALVDLLYKKFFEQINKLNWGNNLRIAVLHGNALEAAEALAERIRKEYNPIELLINITGPVLGINTGPGALALCGYRED
ncbi:MAG: DegV family protein [Chloroflexi bacterium]|nr:DegV family protein [Chloroflexota bacterium]